MEDQLTKNPLCPLCKDVQLTNEEVALYKDGRGGCWYCIAGTFIQMDMADSIPDPVTYGRSGESKQTAIARFVQKKKFGPIDAAAVETGNPPAPGHEAPILTGKPITRMLFNDQERKEFSLAFGVDPVPKVKPTEVIAYGASEDTYMKFSIPLSLDVKEEEEIKRIMKGMLDIFGKLLKFGPQFASTLLELQQINPEMFLGGRK